MGGSRSGFIESEQPLLTLANEVFGIIAAFFNTPIPDGLNRVVEGRKLWVFSVFGKPQSTLKLTTIFNA